MTEKKKLPERKVAYNYWAITEPDPSTLGNVGNGDDPSSRNVDRMQQQQQRWHQDRGRRQRESLGTPTSSRRVVTVPPTDPSYAGNAFVERQRKRREQSQLHDDSGRQTQYVARTLAQTGTRASNGRMPVAHRSLPRQQSPVPARSKRQKPPRNRLLRFLSFLTVLAIAIVLIVFAFTGNVFRIAQVIVVGTHNDVLIQSVQKMGIQGKNIFLLDVTGFTTKIEAFPEVNTVDLNKQWPNQLVVSIKERVPVLLWQTTKATFSVDSQGIVIAPVSSNTAEANHLITVIDTSQQVQQNGHTGNGKTETVLHPGMWINRADIAFAVALIKQLPVVIGESANSFKLYYNGTMYSSTIQSSEEGKDSSGSYTIENSTGGWRAYLGNGDDPNPLSNRLLELRSILNLAQQQQMNVATIDLRYGLHPVFTLQQ